MCTLTIIPFEGGLRLVINRDELRTRPPAVRPTLVDLGNGRRAAWPVDPQSGGTWIAVNDAGLALALLNGNPRHCPSRPSMERRVSRGRLIPALIESRGVEGALDLLEQHDLEQFEPFRLVAAGADRIMADAVWDGSAFRSARQILRPVCFVSSGLGDERAEPRRDLFGEWGAARRWSPELQDEFHRHRWPERPEISVLMDRADARTVSVTTVEISEATAVRMHYLDDSGASTVSFAAPRLRAGWSARASC